jgi:hypothetical protein
MPDQDCLFTVSFKFNGRRVDAAHLTCNVELPPQIVSAILRGMADQFEAGNVEITRAN